MLSLHEFVNESVTVDDETATQILRSVLPTLAPLQDIEKWRPYFSYFKAQCQRAFHDRGRHTLIRTFDDITNVRTLISEKTAKEELAFRVKIQLRPSKPCEKVVLHNTIDLVSRLCLMVSIGCIGRIECVPARQTLVHWEKDNLQSCLSKHFLQPQTQDYIKIRLDRHFTARNMAKIAGWKIQKTDNLADHLKIYENKGFIIIVIFSDVHFLQQQNELLPTRLAEETLQTLMLLYPENSQSSATKFFRTLRMSRPDNDIGQIGSVLPGHRRIENYQIWRDRLVDLKENFDHARPTTLRQFLYDRRDTPAWAAFWIAMVILALTLIQVVEGALQVYKAYHPMLL